MTKTSLRYGGGDLDARSAFIRLCEKLQKTEAVLLDDHPEDFGPILAASNTKGTCLEHILATPAWAPVYSVESVDGELWEELSDNTRHVINHIKWRERLEPIITQNFDAICVSSIANPSFIFDAEAMSRFALRVMYELVFESPISPADELLFYRASLEWRKEIALKGKGNVQVKADFWQRLHNIVDNSKFKDKLAHYAKDPGRWLSVFAQPFLISPQINVSDIMVAAFRLLRSNSKHLKNARQWAAYNDVARLNGVILESIRLQHPFPILERELERDVKTPNISLKAGTQVFMFLDRLKQDKTFEPERWLESPSKNPYTALPFGAGRRMCVGKPIAQELLRGMLQNLLTRFDDEQIQPHVGHLYSGRNNDETQSWRESAYQIKMLSKALWTSYTIGRQKTSAQTTLEPQGQCPYAHLLSDSST